MDTSFNPKEELVRLIGPTPKHPWAALIPQILLWCFRRFCVQKLNMFEGTLEESLCEDILDIVHTYCPKGLEIVSIEWFTPENIEQVASPLEDYMGFFSRFCRYLDDTIRDNDYATQDMLSEFLDESMGTILSGWLDERHNCFLIFPTEAEDDDQFSEGQFSKLINSLLMYSYAKKETAALQEPVVELGPVPEPVVEPLVVEPVVEPVVKSKPYSLLWQLISIPRHSQPIPEPEPEPEPVQVPAPVQVQAPEPVPVTVAEAVHRRRTLCVKGRRAQPPRVKTRKTHPTPYTKEER